MRFACCIHAPDAELFVSGVGLVNPAVAVRVKLGQVGKTVAALSAKQLAAVVDLAVAVGIQRQKAAASAHERHAVGGAVGIQVELERHVAQLAHGPVKVDHQRVFQLGIAQAQAF